jgi:hypothetical protein
VPRKALLSIPVLQYRLEKDKHGGWSIRGPGVDAFYPHFGQAKLYLLGLLVIESEASTISELIVELGRLERLLDRLTAAWEGA